MSFPSAKLMRADAQRNHDAVLAAGKAVFAQAGTEAPMEDVARAAGVGKGTLYRRFPAREHLFAAILQERVDELDAFAQRALDAPDVWRGLGHREGRPDAVRPRPAPPPGPPPPSPPP